MAEFETFLKRIDATVSGPLRSEFAYQMRRCEEEGWEHANKPSVAEEILMLEEYIARARLEWTRNQGDEQALDVVRKVSALALRCLANHGCPPRVAEKK